MYRRFIFLLLPCLFLLGCKKETTHSVDNDGGFPLKEISLAEALQSGADLKYCGQREYLGFEKTWYIDDSTIPKKEVKNYPRLNGPKPLYGSIKFDHNFLKPESGIEYFFTLDSRGNDGYDRLFFDANRDLDLTNDPPIGLNKEPWPAGLWTNSSNKGRVFEELSVPMDFGPGYGVRPVKALPLLFINKDVSGKDVSATIIFAALSFRAGRIKIGNKDFDAVIAQANWINGRFDRPHTNLYLMTPGEKEPLEYWNGSDELGAYRYVDGKYYTLITTPMGDKLFVKPYAMDLGTFKPGPGARDIKESTVAGSLYSPEHSVAIGYIKDVNPEPVTEWQVPVGDYIVDYTKINYGPLRIKISDNYHSDGKRRDMNRQRHFTIQIRKDKPFVLDFSNKPEIMFASPAKDIIFKPGDEVEVNAVLIDPVLDIMIRNLDDTRQKVKQEIDLGDGKKETREKDKSLDPVVTIADSSGKTVAEGPMPFG